MDWEMAMMANEENRGCHWRIAFIVKAAHSRYSIYLCDLRPAGQPVRMRKPSLIFVELRLDPKG